MDEFNFENFNLEEPVIIDFGPDVEIFAISQDGGNIARLSAYFDDNNIVEMEFYAEANDGGSSVGGTIIAEA